MLRWVILFTLNVLTLSSYDIGLEKRLGEETTTLVENYTLPDGAVIKVGAERYQAPEVLFQPHLIDVDGMGMAEQLFDCINKADMDIRTEVGTISQTNR